MGVHYGVYVGPYLAVPHAVQRVSGPVLAQCTGNPNHKVGQYMKFCPDCGRTVKITKNEDLKPDSIRVYDIDGADALVWRPENAGFKDADGVQYDAWISNNRALVGGRYCDTDSGEIISTLENSKLFYDETIKFRAAVQWLIDDIQEQYGVASIIRHGIVPYWN